MRGDTISAAVSQTALLEDILSLRPFIANLQSKLPLLNVELAQALQALMGLFPGEETHHSARSQVSARFEQIIRDLSSALDSVTGALQFMESQRAIMEAESINRLTELAFLFIPLSFAAALFSMQVRELSTSPPVAYFVAFALSLSATTYAPRAVARSAWLQDTKQALLTNIRSFKSLPPGARISNSAILAWFFVNILAELIFRVRHGWFGMNIRLAKLFGLLGYTFLAAIILLPCGVVASLVVLWTRHTDKGLKIGLTFAILFGSSSVLALLFLRLNRRIRTFISELPHVDNEGSGRASAITRPN